MYVPYIGKTCVSNLRVRQEVDKKKYSSQAEFNMLRYI